MDCDHDFPERDGCCVGCGIPVSGTAFSLAAADALAAAVEAHRVRYAVSSEIDRALGEYRKIRPQSAPDGSETAKGD